MLLPTLSLEQFPTPIQHPQNCSRAPSWASISNWEQGIGDLAQAHIAAQWLAPRNFADGRHLEACDPVRPFTLSVPSPHRPTLG